MKILLRSFPRHLAVLLAIAPAACAPLSTADLIRKERYENLSEVIGPWENPYKGRPDLAGVVVTQYPEGTGMAKTPYENRHPESIWYVFWDGNVRAVEYRPDGTILAEGVWDENLRPGDSFWDIVDFSHGSDPAFEKHSDPRKSTSSR